LIGDLIDIIIRQRPSMARRTFQENGMKALLCSITDAAQALGVGRSKTYQLISEGQLLTVHIGRRCLVRVDSVKALAEGEAA